MTVLSEDQITVMTMVMDDILKRHNMSVQEIKNKYHLTDDEYNMIFDLCMPNIRENSWEAFWKQAYGSLRKEIRNVIRKTEITDSEKLQIIKGMCAYENRPKKTEKDNINVEEEEAI